VHALTWQGVGSIRAAQVPDPVLREPRDAIVEVVLAGLCGSDLHVYHGRETGLDPGTVMGHEFVGRVVQTGEGVRGLSPGDRVAAPFSTCCGDCYYCARGLSARCVAAQLFGWVEQGAGLEGAQASFVRVPLADATLFPLPDDLGDAESLLLCDVLPTGHFGATQAGAAGGVSCAVLGLGPVGLAAVLAAGTLGATPILAVDTVPERLARAASFGATPVDARGQDPAAAIRSATGGRGADAVIEAIGSSEAARLAFDLVRPGGTIATVGVHHEARFPFSPAQAYDRNLTWRIGRCPARSLMEGLVPLARARAGDLAALVTHRLPLAEGERGYALFDAKSDGCIKVAFAP
jgi:threonine dehydrogenase-like Zn-dependent dehydrogenase